MALAYWKAFNLPKLQRELDTVAGDLAKRQDLSDLSRKQLVDHSKEFKKTAPEDVRQQVTPLLKSFQEEVDSLSRRSKAAETAFLSLYKKIVEAPDPSAALENAESWQKKAHKAQDLEIECSNLRETLEQYNAEFAEIKNQEVTIRQLREKVKSFEDAIDNAVEEKVRTKEAELKSFYEERESQLQEAGNILSAKVKDSEKRAEALQASLKAAQQELFSLRARADESTDAKSHELDMLLSDSERAQQRAEAAEREVTVLKEKLEALQSLQANPSVNEEAESGESSVMASLEVEVRAKEKQVSQLLSDMRSLEQQLERERADWSEKEQGLEKRLSAQSASIQALERRLAEQKDYEDIKRELSVIKSIELGVGSEEGKSLEVALLERNKSLQNENTGLKLCKQELEGPEEENGALFNGKPFGSGTPPGPLQQVVDAMGCFIGAELVSAYAQQLHQQEDFVGPSPDPDTPDPPEERLLSSQRRIKRLLGSVDEAGEEDLQKVLRTHDLFDVDKAIRNGMPKIVAESLAIERLQSIVSDNVKKLGDVSLNTGEVAAHCRQLLTMYNLGQRLFAKTILNQSQGSLSELLSKPRPWQRLTEKGREAFRKMYAWVSDERSIALLRSLSPRRPYMSTRSDPKPPPPDLTPLSPAPDDLYANGGPSEEDSAAQTNGKLNANNRWRHDDIPKEMVYQIYQRELSKLKEQEATLQQELKGRSPRVAPGRGRSLASPTNSLLDSILPRTRSPSKDLLRPDSTDPRASSRASSLGDPVRTPHTSTSSRSLKAVLPAITQEQFETYSTLNTEELVRAVKDFLSNQSISQRLFGEHVLGLSQGSVSDLLARPKPWHMLTQKGREPFIRMQMFLDDDSQVEVLRGKKGGYASEPRRRGTPDQAEPVRRARRQEAAASPGQEELDTQAIVDRVKNILHSNSIGQKVFGETVLGVSQGTVSELLSKPKQWALLSLRGREPYIRMKAWLQDPESLEKLESSARGLGKRTPEEVRNHEAPPCKKTRALISEEQKEALKFAFEHDPYPSSKTLEFLAQELDLSLRTVVNWFHNHRMRVKLQASAPSPPVDSEAGNNSRPQGSSWKKGLMDVISMLSSGDASSTSSQDSLSLRREDSLPSPLPPDSTHDENGWDSKA